MARFAFEVRASRLWFSLLLVGLLLAQCLAPRLRGAAVGLERWIDATDFLAAWVTQVAGVTGSLLIVRLLVEALRDVPRRASSALVAALSFLPGFVVLVAAEGPVFGALHHLSGISLVTLGGLVTLARLFLAPRAAIFPTLVVVSCGCRLLLTLETPAWPSSTFVARAGATATLLALFFAVVPALLRKPTSLGVRTAEARSVPHLGFLSGAVGVGCTHFFITAVVDPTWSDVFSAYPLVVGALALALPLSAYLIWFPTLAHKNASTSLLLLPCVLPLSPLSLAAATLGFLLMHLTEAPRKSPAILAA